MAKGTTVIDLARNWRPSNAELIAETNGFFAEVGHCGEDGLACGVCDECEEEIRCPRQPRISDQTRRRYVDLPTVRPVGLGYEKDWRE